MPIEWFDDPRTGGSGFTIIDLNNDVFDDILPRNGWAQMNEQGRITSYGIFLNEPGPDFVLELIFQENLKFSRKYFRDGRKYFRPNENI